ncbi:hypothetical protein A3B21_00475 [Candidatus Uhrbacteria bacterium RIFCSPLOWO2_01_FULL_47_24]|uniref:RadC-like JAB domain-containing protein n=1 Tax=Candidatus Uhrbacteria bacterium RIFCSPLOWO2_01_FULL_47_24 TaxID=1802401 RepID=A0A1F7USU8_9BACT|nr:MAG: hypothetical protein A3B21_00475 [Candidatus Uhrbacteria bacterium RIFCSPLOWO2_01_FULL_47_24]OGL83817.1 MAG: hypothetical protein A3J03_02835 [Candidatus Uhrbacteria bacterium RIFCSPLOWO2_02_FULL_46_25]OGL91667.1 MAG: hypothetical protein A3H11_05165 [Candidatus Uhrbacteria bacterium RIFCSPLOWO2_12_FULL_47_10]
MKIKDLPKIVPCLSKSKAIGNKQQSASGGIGHERSLSQKKMTGVEIMDHVIVSKNSRFSFKEKKLL